MMSITKIIILITAIIAIRGETLDLRRDADQSSDTLYHLNAYKLALKKGCFGKYTMECIDEARTKRPHYPEVRQPIEDMVASLRKRRQALEQTKGSDDGPNSAMSLVTRSSSPIRSMIRNRNRRSSSIPDTSSNKNTKEMLPPPVVKTRPPKLTTNQRILISLLATLTMPYLVIVPNKDYEQSTEIYYS